MPQAPLLDPSSPELELASIFSPALQVPQNPQEASDTSFIAWTRHISHGQPHLNCVLKHLGKTITLTGLIDTGTDITLMSKNLRLQDWTIVPTLDRLAVIWKQSAGTYRENPDKMARVVKMITKTQNLDWNDIRVILDTLMDSTEKEMVLRVARERVREDIRNELVNRNFGL
ncbi:hypothetical protein DUI87_01939 [Hirundo rustica rustica]|uniref:Peptidase A2 domain-containing protein n=1 Tax=Hirundo rustica rustica TaxID=333673 RepID=A0A3M0L5Y8_HIRRU|nr:hypothetical protein DUI87_01939 [Hirundo rustica rustica]